MSQFGNLKLFSDDLPFPSQITRESRGLNPLSLSSKSHLGTSKVWNCREWLIDPIFISFLFSHLALQQFTRLNHLFTWMIKTPAPCRFKVCDYAATRLLSHDLFRHRSFIWPYLGWPSQCLLSVLAHSNRRRQIMWKGGRHLLIETDCWTPRGFYHFVSLLSVEMIKNGGEILLVMLKIDCSEWFS